jgi:hypothetical protein
MDTAHVRGLSCNSSSENRISGSKSNGSSPSHDATELSIAHYRMSSYTTNTTDISSQITACFDIDSCNRSRQSCDAMTVTLPFFMLQLSMHICSRTVTKIHYRTVQNSWRHTSLSLYSLVLRACVTPSKASTNGQAQSYVGYTCSRLASIRTKLT